MGEGTVTIPTESVGTEIQDHRLSGLPRWAVVIWYVLMTAPFWAYRIEWMKSAEKTFLNLHRRFHPNLLFFSKPFMSKCLPAEALCVGGRFDNQGKLLSFTLKSKKKTFATDIIDSFCQFCGYIVENGQFGSPIARVYTRVFILSTLIFNYYRSNKFLLSSTQSIKSVLLSQLRSPAD